MATLQIRDLPEHVREALALRAERARRSLAQQAVIDLQAVPELERRQQRRVLLARIIEELAITGERRVPASTDPEMSIAADRDR